MAWHGARVRAPPTRPRRAGTGPSTHALHARQRRGVDVEELVHRRLVLRAERGVAVVAVAAARHRRVVGDVARGLLEVGAQPRALQDLRQDVRDPLAGDVRAAELGDRVVAVADEDPLVELRGALALVAVERPRRPAGSESANSSRNSRRSVPW